MSNSLFIHAYSPGDMSLTDFEALFYNDPLTQWHNASSGISQGGKDSAQSKAWGFSSAWVASATSGSSGGTSTWGVSGGIDDDDGDTGPNPGSDGSSGGSSGGSSSGTNPGTTTGSSGGTSTWGVSGGIDDEEGDTGPNPGSGDGVGTFPGPPYSSVNYLVGAFMGGTLAIDVKLIEFVENAFTGVSSGNIADGDDVITFLNDNIGRLAFLATWDY